MSRNPLSRDALREFTDSMPKEYLERHSHEAIERHATVAVGRRSERVRVAFAALPEGGAEVCFAADDRPGLLAGASASLANAGLSIESGALWLRTTRVGNQEALGVFVVHPNDGSPVDASHAELVSETLTNHLEGRPAPPVAPRPAPAAGEETRVRFLEGADGALTVLEVTTGDRSGLLSALAGALFEQRVQIVAAQVQTQGGRVHDTFTVVELDGSPISAARRLGIQVAVLTAVDVAQRGEGCT
ncbi:MAG: hypothetical protein KIT72_03875 [Polyangiaceae bacterium]|nr:hypothetical protein [Polyangiaceae bacterium]MCW5789541.1 hypothetical protein [Polyangiaceae bacterium]